MIGGILGLDNVQWIGIIVLAVTWSVFGIEMVRAWRSAREDREVDQ